MPDQSNASPCLQRYLDALPRGEYFGKGYQVIATDGSLRLNRFSTKEPAMGVGVMWHDTAIPNRSERVGSQYSSTRAELAAVVMVLQGTPRADDQAILIDSTAAIQRLRWFRSHSFRPAEHTVRDYDLNAATSRTGYSISTKSHFEKVDNQFQEFIQRTGGSLIQSEPHTRKDLMGGASLDDIKSATLDNIITWNFTNDDTAKMPAP